MFFKNAYIFAFTRPFTTTELELEALLQENAFTPLGSTEVRHFGFVNALGKHGSSLTHVADGNILICARSEEKILPAAVIKDMVEESVYLHEFDLGRALTRKEREQQKEDVIFELLPRAFNRIVDTHAYISPKNNTIVINSASRGKAEDLLALLRKALGTLPVTSINPDKDASETMTDWLSYPDSLTQGLKTNKIKLGNEADFSGLGDDSATAKVKNENLLGLEVQSHLDADQYVTKIALEYDESMSFILSDDLSIKRIKFFDVLTECPDLSDDTEELSEQENAACEFAIMSGELNRMTTDLHAEFGTHAVECLEDAPVPAKQLTKLNVNQQEVKVESDGFAVEVFYDDAVEFIKETRRASIISLQRKFRIGYNRTARLMEQLEEKGIVSLPGHNGAREVLI